MKNIKINSCNITYCDDQWNFDSCQSQSWDDYDLWIVLEGKGTLTTCSEIKYDLHPGDCFILKPDESYKASHDKSNKLVVFHTHFNNINLYMELQLYRNLFQFEIINYFINKIHTNYLSNDLEQAHLWMNAILLEIKHQDSLNRVTKQNNRHSTIINIITNAIHRNPEIKHSLANYAKLYNYSYDYLGRIFKEVTNTSISQYVINVRINKAKLLLRDNSLTIKQVSTILGYSDTCFFNKQFKRFVYVTPTQYKSKIT